MYMQKKEEGNQEDKINYAMASKLIRFVNHKQINCKFTCIS